MWGVLHQQGGDNEFLVESGGCWAQNRGDNLVPKLVNEWKDMG